MFTLSDFPHHTRWITPEEGALTISRLTEDGHGKVNELGEQTTMQEVLDAVSDWKVQWFSVTAMFHVMGQSFFVYFMILCATLGYDTTVTLLLGAFAWYPDKKQRRLHSSLRWTKLHALLMAQVVAGYSAIVGWINNTFAREPAKRTVAIALINALRQTGNIIGSYVWPSNWGLTYRHFYVVCIAALWVSTGGMYLYLRHSNEQIERNEQDVKDITSDSLCLTVTPSCCSMTSLMVGCCTPSPLPFCDYYCRGDVNSFSPSIVAHPHRISCCLPPVLAASSMSVVSSTTKGKMSRRNTHHRH